VLCPDLRGYGDTDCPRGRAHYRMEALCGDLLGLLDRVGAERAVFVGHDWGGTLVWNLSAHYPERVAAVAGVCTPFFDPDPKRNPWTALRRGERDRRFNYQLYFNSDAAVAEFERDPERALAITIRGTAEQDLTAMDVDVELAKKLPTERKSLLNHVRNETVPRSLTVMPSARDLSFYASQFERSGFHGAMGWYRNVEENWRWNCKTVGKKMTRAALMVTTGRDEILTAKQARRLMLNNPLLPNLTMRHVEAAGHWVMQEQPQQFNSILLEWLEANVCDETISSRL